SVTFKVSAVSNSPLHRSGVGGEEEKSSDVRKPGGFLTGNQSVGSLLRDHARENRNATTEAENLLWQNLRNRKLGYKFRRQHPIDNYIADFVCLEKKLIIELDGEQHKEDREYDIERTKTLEAHGYKVMRFWNEEVVKSVSEVLEEIRNELKSRPNLLTPDPSPEERGAENFSS